MSIMGAEAPVRPAHEMSVMGAEGDTKHIWDPAIPDEVTVMEEMFRSFIHKGYAAFSVNDAGDKGGQIQSFDPQAGKIIMVPPLRGG